MLLYTQKPDILCLSETWITKHEPKFIDYSAEWKHRDRMGGGLGFIIRGGVQYNIKNLTPYPSGFLEFQCVELFLRDGNRLDILHIYNPNENVTEAEFSHYFSQLGTRVVMLGDFNAHTSLLNTNCARSNVTGKSLEKLLANEMLCLINPLDFYTYLNAATGSRSCLDVCLTSPNIAAETSMSQSPDVGSDHIPVKIVIDITPVRATVTFRTKYKTNHANLVKFSEDIQPSHNVTPMDINTVTTNFTERLIHSADQHIPKTSGIFKRKTGLVGWNEECSVVVYDRRKARRQLERHPTLMHVCIYRERTLQSRKICKAASVDSIHKFVSEIRHDTPLGEAWNKFQALKGRTRSSQVSPLYSEDEYITDSVSKAEALAAHFSSIAVTGQHDISQIAEEDIAAACDDGKDEDYNRDISVEEVHSALNSSKDTAAGLDKISYLMLRALNPGNVSELCGLYNQSFTTGWVPDSWKLALTVPIRKPNKPAEEITSYRPIALLSCIGKTMERIVQRRLEYVVEQKQMLLGSQSGFRKQHSTMDVLLQIEHNIRKSLAENEVCVLIYIDLKNAFELCGARD